MNTVTLKFFFKLLTLEVCIICYAENDQMRDASTSPFIKVISDFILITCSFKYEFEVGF